MDAQHGGRALDSYLEDPGSILLSSFQRVFSPPLVLFSVGPPPPRAAACNWAWCRTVGEWSGARQHGGERERGGPKGQKTTAQTQVKNSSALVLFQIFYYSPRKKTIKFGVLMRE